MLLACLFFASYLLGAVPFGVLVSRSKGIDVTKIGSGNIGATNVRRALGMKWAIPVFLLDVGKGMLPPLLARSLTQDHWLWYLVGLAAVAGHCASPFLRFKGGKGVATSLGMVFGASPLVAATSFVIFALLLGTTRYMSLSSIIGVFASVLVAVFLRDWTYVGIGSALFLFVLYTHRANIRRLMNGTEPKFEFRKQRGPQGDADEDGGLGVPSPVVSGPPTRSGAAAQEPPTGGT